MHSVVYLIRKDFILTYRYLLLLLPFMLLMTWGQPGSLLLYVTLPSIFMLITSCTFDMQNGTPRFTASLPVTRSQVVLSKYASLIPFTIFGVACGIALQAAVNAISSGGVSFGAKEVVAVVLMNTVIGSLYLPLYFWLGPKGMQVVRLVFIMIVAFASVALGTLIQEMPSLGLWMNGDIPGGLFTIFGVIAAALLTVSIGLSFRLYRRQEIS